MNYIIVNGVYIEYDEKSDVNGDEPWKRIGRAG
jgi:hypothetical protein